MSYPKESIERIEKLNKLKNAGVIPYANKFPDKQDISFLIENKGTLKDGDTLTQTGAEGIFKTAGRLTLFRSHGKISFGKIIDCSGIIQICLVRDLVVFNKGKETVNSLKVGEQEYTAYKLFEKMIDLGDIIGVSGDLFLTKHGEITLFVKEFQLLSKAIRPLPEKFHGIQDKETLYRQRYLELISDDDAYKRFLFRSKLVKTLRDFYDENGFIEVETPVLGNAASGAAAAPFITHHNYFDHDFYLRISPETALKKTTVGRFEKIFEIARDFRNEGSDPSHLQEFTMVEHYAAFWNFEDNMQFTEKMFDYLFSKLNLDKIVKIKDKEGIEREVNFTTPWEKIDYIQGVKNSCGIDVQTYTMEDGDILRQDIRAKGIEFEGMDKMGTTTLIDYLYKKVLRPNILGPAFVYNYPKTMQPLARVSDENENIVEQFQLVVNGWEMLKAYSELVDPIIQQKNFDEQAQAQAQGDEEATSGDSEFVHAMEYGMPPQSGFGMGIDRLVTILLGLENLRDSILFPLVKPHNEE
ncbi:MAG: lysine--tRNA ligase [Candidatus Absconditabacteria bacterium]